MLKFFRKNEEKDKEKTAKAVQKSRQTWFGKMATLFSQPSLDDGTWDELEELLISADVGVATTMKLLETLKTRISEEKLTEPAEVMEALKDEMVYLIDFEDASETLEAPEKPLVILMVGVNGAGKTTSIAKLSQLYLDSGKTVLLGAADTFRAAAIEQLQVWAERIGVDVIAHQSGADPGAVAFDTIQAAKARGTDVVIIDTAGRLHTKFNLMEELKKIQRIMERQGVGSHRVLVTIDATTGQNGLIQARAFTEAVDCEGIFLAKVDSSSKGGIVFGIADELDLPILFIGTGEKAEDVATFQPQEFVDGLFSDGNGS
jgi:fused signal recognition particle receptor